MKKTHNTIVTIIILYFVAIIILLWRGLSHWHGVSQNWFELNQTPSTSYWIIAIVVLLLYVIRKKIGGKLTALMAIIAIFAFSLNVFTPEMYKGLLRAGNAKQKVTATRLHGDSMEWETEAATIWGVAAQKATLYTLHSCNKKLTKVSDLEEGSLVQVIDHTEDLPIYAGQTFLKVKLPDANGGFIDGPEYLSPSRYFKWGNNVGSGEGFTLTKIKKAESEVWVIYLHTDNLVTIDRNFPVGTSFMVSGVPYGSLKWTNPDDGKFYNVILGSKLTNDHRTDLSFKGQRNQKIQIRFL